MTSQAIFVFRLRLHRERQRIPLDRIAAATRIRPERLEALERNDVSEWPRGLYARAWVRAYAAMVGLDPADTVEDFCRLFPQGDRRARDTIRAVAAIIAHPSEYRDEVREADRRRGTPHTDVARATPLRDVMTRAVHALGVMLAVSRAPMRPTSLF